MTTGRGNLRLLRGGAGDGDIDQPEWERSRRLHPAQRGRDGTGALLYISGDCEGRIRFARAARRWERFRLLVVEGGRAGVRVAGERRPKLVVVDDHLADVDAAEVVAYLRQRTLPAEIPIVVLAQNDEARHHARFCRAGASAFHTKPLNISELDRSVATFLGVESSL